METVLAKLAEMIGDKSTNLIDLTMDTAFLRDELCTVNALLMKLEDEDELDPQVKDWSNQVRELGYDIEDCIDDFTHRVGSADAKAGFIQKISHFVDTMRARLETAKQIKVLKTRLWEVNERRKRYKLERSISGSSSVVVVDPRLPALYREPANLVGIDGPRDELIRWVTDEKEQLKVVSIIGSGGSGKTTLANEVYRTVKGQFDCHVFVSVSQRPDMTRLLHSIRLKLGQQGSSYTCEVKDLIDGIRKFLQHKRYFIIVDDLWDISTWDILSCAFPENNLRSRSIVTTRIENVAMACCTHQGRLYRLRPLSDQDSQRLLFGRTLDSEHACSSEIKEISTEILRKCGGLPLAIITVASIIASRPTRKREDWEKILNSLGSEPGTNSMRQILNLSYKDLPRHLKACFLYIGMYPEDHIIQRVDLVRQWIAEGLVNNSHRQGVEDVANNYFDDLVNRSLIEPEETDYNGKVMSCRVHDMMLDLIISKCIAENFISVVYDSRGIRELHNTKIRRFTLKLNGPKGGATSADKAISIQPHIRSFALFANTGRISECAPLFPESKFLRVLILDLQEIDGRDRHEEVRIDLTSLSQLFLLRYLKIHARTSMVKLPTRIQGLRHLETLEIYCRLISYPSDLFYLPGLLHLIVTSHSRFPDGISNAKFLHTLQYFDLLENSLETIHGLGELMNLRILTIRCFQKFLLETDTGRSALDAFHSSLGKLGSRNLKYLSVVRYPEICADTMSSISPPHHLETLDLLAWWFSRIPQWLAKLHNLCSLDLCVREVMQEDVSILGAMPSLMHLQFQVQEIPKEKIIIHGNTAHLFPVLRNFQFKCERTVSLQLLKFEAGAMPHLRRLEIETTEKLLEWYGGMPAGMEHLLGLKEICLYILHGQGTESERMAAESAFRSITQMHPSRPTITII
ncbi:hypothetical protein EJB05_12391 [Eragrostis curvula]|uniref:AAA+ ATPase domain-containing protein n=1 Tax=Eragrostis curvula TaxID=38414 RepID=A0A5J9VRG9_9POAL|nr:hypothetical protein EJB05_12391 [Eragrostis curvula]